MAIFPQYQVGGIADEAVSVAELTKEQYNAAAVDDDGTEFAASVTAAALLDAAALTNHTGQTASAADSLAIPITAPVCLKTTGGDAEALTIAAGTFIGQTVTIQLVVDGGGDGTLSSASPLWATIVFADAGDTVTLEWRGTTAMWVITSALGLTAQPTITMA